MREHVGLCVCACVTVCVCVLVYTVCSLLGVFVSLSLHMSWLRCCVVSLCLHGAVYLCQPPPVRVRETLPMSVCGVV